MAIIHVRPGDRLHLESIASLFGAASKIVTVTGAGIIFLYVFPLPCLPTYLLDLALSIEERRLFP